VGQHPCRRFSRPCRHLASFCWQVIQLNPAPTEGGQAAGGQLQLLGAGARGLGSRQYGGQLRAQLPHLLAPWLSPPGLPACLPPPCKLLTRSAALPFAALAQSGVPPLQTGVCRRGDACPYSHGVFECWLHPSRYRTQVGGRVGRVGLVRVCAKVFMQPAPGPGCVA